MAIAWALTMTRKLCQIPMIVPTRLTLKQVAGAWPSEDGPPCLRSPALLASSWFKSLFLRSACRPLWPGTEKIRPLEFEGDSAGPPRLRFPILRDVEVQTTTKTVVSAPRPGSVSVHLSVCVCVGSFDLLCGNPLPPDAFSL